MKEANNVRTYLTTSNVGSREVSTIELSALKDMLGQLCLS